MLRHAGVGEITTMSFQSSNDTVRYCTECQGHGWTPSRPCDDVLDVTVSSRGPHRKCSEPSLTLEQQRVWEAVRDLPGVKLRGRRPNASSSQPHDITCLCTTLFSLFVLIVSFIINIYVYFLYEER